ncbi:hypothetical protein ACFTAO_35290 [Paenibacillus rhizoplanae]
MNSHAFKKYNIEVDIGQPFEQEDFNNTDNHTIPVLLGADYKSKIQNWRLIEGKLSDEGF